MSQPGLLSSTIYFAGTRTQPNKFPSSEIEDEVMASGESATWRALYDRAKRGDAISVPFYDVKVTGVRTMNRKGKPRRSRYKMTKTSDWKRAIVVLDENSRIELF